MRAGTRFGDARDRALQGLTGRDRRLAHELAAGVLRRQAALDHAFDIRRADPCLHDVLRLGVYQLRCLARIPPHAAVATAVALARETAGEKAATYVNQALRSLARAPGSRERGAVPSHPGWLLSRWRRRFGRDETARLVAWNDARPPLTIQPARWDAATLAARLRDAEVAVGEAPFGAGVRLVAGSNRSPLPAPRALPGFADGGFIVQDPAHALVCRFAAVPAGSLVYDACAAPGGKAVTLEGLGARVVAGDARRARASTLAETARRAGRAIRVLVADLLAPPLAMADSDAVLVDAPCSATGTMARHPDARWRITPRAIERIAARQRALLEAAAPLVRPGGLLVYATCSLEPEENEVVVEAFLSRHTEFGREPAPDAVPATLLTARGDFQSLPQRHGTDGAYAVRLARVS